MLSCVYWNWELGVQAALTPHSNVLGSVKCHGRMSDSHRLAHLLTKTRASATFQLWIFFFIVHLPMSARIFNSSSSAFVQCFVWVDHIFVVLIYIKAVMFALYGQHIQLPFRISWPGYPSRIISKDTLLPLSHVMSLQGWFKIIKEWQGQNMGIPHHPRRHPYMQGPYLIFSPHPRNHIILWSSFREK